MALLLQDRLLPGVAELVPELEEIRHDIPASRAVSAAI